MKFDITIVSDQVAAKKQHIIVSTKETLKQYLKNKDYGKDIQDYSIVLICVGNQFEHLHPIKKPKYVDYKAATNPYTGMPHILDKWFTHYIKFESSEYEEFINATDEGSRKLLEKKIIDSLASLESLPKKIKDFDKEKFKKDLEGFLHNE